MTHRDGFPRFSARSAWRGDAGHRKPCAPSQSYGQPESLGKPPFRSGRRTGSGRIGGGVGKPRRPVLRSSALPLRRMDVPQDPRLPCYPPDGPPDGPPDRLHDLYGSLSALLGTNMRGRVCRDGGAISLNLGAIWDTPEENYRQIGCCKRFCSLTVIVNTFVY